MRLGIVGPKKSIDQITAVIENSFEYLDITRLEYTNYHEVPDIIAQTQRGLDALLFSGTTPFTFASRINTPSIPWEYIPRHGSTLLTMLLELSAVHGLDISKISFDSYQRDILNEVYDEIGISESERNLLIAENKITADNYVDYLYAFHKENYLEKKVSCCVTGLDTVQKQLSAQGICCFKLRHTSNIIRETITKLRLKHLAHIEQNNQIVVLAVEMDLPDEQSILYANEYQLSTKKVRIMEQVYLYGQKIQAAVVEQQIGQCLLFTTKGNLESETMNLTKIDLPDMVRKTTANTVSIGIGYGRTAMEAKSNALQGKERAKKSGGNRIFLVYENEKIIGPLGLHKPGHEQESIVDKQILEAAVKTGLGKNTIFKLHSILAQYRIDAATPKELARLYGVTLRSMNRIIAMLELAGYAEYIGKKSATDFGRPSRVIRIKL